MKKTHDSSLQNSRGRWVGNYGQKSSNRRFALPRSEDGVEGFKDQNITDGVQQHSSHTGYVDGSLDD